MGLFAGKRRACGHYQKLSEREVLLLVGCAPLVILLLVYIYSVLPR